MPIARRSRAAADDIVAIYIDGIERFGRVQADCYLDRMEAVFDFLAGTPEAARLRPEVDPPVRAFPFESHMIVYEIDDHGDVLILRVRGARENWKSRSR